MCVIYLAEEKCLRSLEVRFSNELHLYKDRRENSKKVPWRADVRSPTFGL